MTTLKNAQVEYIKQDLMNRGIHYSPLEEDLLDHICTSVEERMSNGLKFKKAYEQALESFYPESFNEIQDQTLKNIPTLMLFSSYITTAFRNLRKHWLYTTINTFGLISGLTICILIFSFIQYELSYDKQYADQNLYRLTSTINRSNGQVVNTAFTGAPWGPVMVQEIPELLESTRFMKYRLDVLVTGEESQQSFYEPNLIWADQATLSLFNLQLLQGNPEEALNQPNSVVISQSIARKYFGSESAIGKVLVYNNEVPLTVTGIMPDMPENMHFKADFLCSFSSLASFWRIIDNWGILYYYTYFKVQEGADLASLEAKSAAFFDKYMGQEWTQSRTTNFQQVKDIHLYSSIDDELKSNTDIRYLYLLGLIALVILGMASANFINLTITRSLGRLREVGMRKVMGGLKADLVIQFLIESLLMVGLAMLFALFVAYALLPYFNALLGKQIELFGPSAWQLIIGCMITSIALSTIAATYPAFHLSKVQTIAALKGKMSKSLRSFSLKDGLILFQLSTSMILLIAISVIRGQQSFILDKDLGFEKENVFVIATNNVPTNRLELVKQELLSLSDVKSVSITSHQLAGDQPYSSAYTFNIPDQAPDTLTLGRLHIDQDFVQTFALNIVAGRDLDHAIPNDTSSFLVNETTVRQLGISNEEALNTIIDYSTQGEDSNYPRRGRIVGVVEDFNFQSLHYPIRGFVMDIQPPRAHFFNCKLTATDDLSKTLGIIEEKMAEMVPNTPMEAFFLDGKLNKMYENEALFNKLMTIASSIALLIVFLGLVALISHTTMLKRREIGVRKVLGASNRGILWLISRRFAILVSIGLVLSAPIAYIWMTAWLKNFAQRIDFPYGVIAITGLFTLAITLTTIYLVAGKAAISNPAKTLRYE